MTAGKIFGACIMLAGVVTIGAEILFIHDWDILVLGIVNIIGGVLIIVSDNRLIRTRKEAKLARAAADEAQQQLQTTIDRLGTTKVVR